MCKNDFFCKVLPMFLYEFCHISELFGRRHNRCSIEDTGKGISDADRKDIFKFFVKVDDLSEGLGLGLPLAKRHIQTLGGELSLDTDYHEGCRFIIDLPSA